MNNQEYKCPKCNNLMIFVKEDESFNGENKKYNRTIYTCKECDCWITVEIPNTEESTVK